MTVGSASHGASFAALANLRGELAEGQVLRLVLDQAVRRDVPEGGGAAVAEDDLVALGQLEQLLDAFAHPADQVLDRGLAVGGAEEGGTGGGQGVQRLRTHLGGARAETSVGGLDVSGNLDISHVCSLVRPFTRDGVRSTR